MKLKNILKVTLDSLWVCYLKQNLLITIKKVLDRTIFLEMLSKLIQFKRIIKNKFEKTS